MLEHVLDDLDHISRKTCSSSIFIILMCFAQYSDSNRLENFTIDYRFNRLGHLITFRLLIGCILRLFHLFTIVIETPRYIIIIF